MIQKRIDIAKKRQEQTYASYFIIVRCNAIVPKTFYFLYTRTVTVLQSHNFTLHVPEKRGNDVKMIPG